MADVTALVASLRDEEPPAVTFDPAKSAPPEPALAKEVSGTSESGGAQ
jgi:hypothetical protein